MRCGAATGFAGLYRRPCDNRSMPDARARGWTVRSLVPALLVSVIVVTAACGSPAPTASPSSSPSGVPPTTLPTPERSPSPTATVDPAAVYDQIEQQVIEIRGLQPSRPVPRESIDASELRTMLTEEFDRESPPTYVAATERLYKALGLIPVDSNLRDLTL